MKSTGIVPRSAKDQRISVRGAQAPGLGGSISGRPGGCREHRIDPPARGFVGYKGPRQGTDPLSYQLLRPVGCPGLAMPRPDAPWGLGRPAARPGARPPPRARRPRALEQAAHNWPLQTNVWPEITSPTRGRKRQRSGPTMFAGRIRCCESFLVERIVGTMQRS